MSQARRAGCVGRWTSLAVPLVALVAGCSMSGTRNLPAVPPEVRSGVQDVESAFASAKTDPPTFVKLAKEALPRLREAMQRWQQSAPNVEHRSKIRAWALQAGQVETAVMQLPAQPSPADLKPVRDAWAGFRASLP